MLPATLGQHRLVGRCRRLPKQHRQQLPTQRHCPCQQVATLAAQQGPLAEPSDQTEEERTVEVLQNVTRRIQALGRAGKPKEAIKELAGLATVGVEPDTQAATALVHACASSRNMELAQSVFDELFGEFLQPDEVTFAVMLRGYGAMDPPQWSKIDAVLTSMRGTYNLDITAVIYNSLLEVCVRTNDMDRGMDVIDRMQTDRVEPNDSTADIVQPRRALRSYLKKVFGSR